MKQTLLIAACLFVFHFSFGKNSLQIDKRKCGSMENLQRLQSIDPDLEITMAEIEDHTTKYRPGAEAQSSYSAPVTIPVVFHIIYNSPSQNITDAQCQAQVSQLNLDFARLNADASNIPAIWQGVAANTNIQFCLAQRDPNGAATTGIVRRNTTVASFAPNDAMKQYSTGGLNAWSTSSYLNIWVVNLTGAIGYAQFPGGPAATDGVVLHYGTVGSLLSPGSFTNYNLGRTATHEVGHWLNLRHIWGDDPDCAGSDLVGDTPNQGTENYGCPSFPHIDNCTPASPGVMFMNYMDYTDDACMNMFTSGQSTRMNALFDVGGARNSLLTSQGCVPPSTPTCGTPGGLSVTSITSNGATLNWTAVPGANTYSLKYKKSTSSTWTTVSCTTNSKTISGLSAITPYNWQLQAVCSFGGGMYSTVNTFTTAVPPPCSVPSPLSSSNITAGSATISWPSVSGALGYSIQYKITGANTWLTTSSTTSSKLLSGLIPNSDYTYQVSTTCQSGSSTYSTPATFSTPASSCSDLNEPNNTYLSSTAIPTNTDITGQINTSTDADWFGFTTTAPNTKIMIVLSNMPKDYNVAMYNASFMQIGTSILPGIANDTIKKNFTTAGTYYIKVVGKNGAFDAVLCYNLRVHVSNVNFRTIEEEENISSGIETSMSVFPNPVKDILNISFTSPSSQSATLHVFNMVGKTVSKIAVEVIEGENRYSADFTGYHKGIYFVEIIQGNDRITRKVVLD